MNPEEDPVFRQMEQAARRSRVLGGIFLTLVGLFVVGSLGIATYTALEVREITQRDLAARQRARAEASFGRQVIECVLAELGELRESAEAHYRTVPTTTPSRRPSLEEAAPDVAEQLERACQPVIDQLRKRNGGGP